MGDDATSLTQPVLLDNTVLTNLALAGRDDLAKSLWPSRACTTPSTLNKYRAGAASGLVPFDCWDGLAVAVLTEEEVAFARLLPPRLGAGERECLAVAVHRHGLLASDDLDVRRIAQANGVPRTGTVGILVLCVRRGYLARDQANALLSEMIALGYRSPVTSLDLVLDKP